MSFCFLILKRSVYHFRATRASLLRARLAKPICCEALKFEFLKGGGGRRSAVSRATVPPPPCLGCDVPKQSELARGRGDSSLQPHTSLRCVGRRRHGGGVRGETLVTGFFFCFKFCAEPNIVFCVVVHSPHSPGSVADLFFCGVRLHEDRAKPTTTNSMNPGCRIALRTLKFKYFIERSWRLEFKRNQKW